MGEYRRQDDGFSLVEAMVAAAIFAGVILSMGQLVVTFLDAMRSADRQSQVMSRAEDYFSRCFVIPFGASTDDPADEISAANIFDNVDLDQLYVESSLHSLLKRGGGAYEFDTIEDPSGADPFAYVVGGSWKIEINHDIDDDGLQGAHDLENSDKILRIEVYFLDFDVADPLVAGVRFDG